MPGFNHSLLPTTFVDNDDEDARSFQVLPFPGLAEEDGQPLFLLVMMGEEFDFDILSPTQINAKYGVPVSELPGYIDSEASHRERSAERIRAYINTFADEGVFGQEALRDLLTDVLHFATEEELDLLAAKGGAHKVHLEEMVEDGDQPPLGLDAPPSSMGIHVAVPESWPELLDGSFPYDPVASPNFEDGEHRTTGDSDPQPHYDDKRSAPGEHRYDDTFATAYLISGQSNYWLEVEVEHEGETYQSEPYHSIPPNVIFEVEGEKVVVEISTVPNADFEANLLEDVENTFNEEEVAA